jgi:hypothetical protein
MHQFQSIETKSHNRTAKEHICEQDIDTMNLQCTWLYLELEHTSPNWHCKPQISGGGEVEMLEKLKTLSHNKAQNQNYLRWVAEDIDHDANLYFSSSLLHQVISSFHDSRSAWETCTQTIIVQFSRYAWTLGVLDYELNFLALAPRGLSSSRA